MNIKHCFKIDSSHVGTFAYSDSYVMKLQRKIDKARSAYIELASAMVNRCNSSIPGIGCSLCSIAVDCPAKAIIARAMADD